MTRRSSDATEVRQSLLGRVYATLIQNQLPETCVVCQKPCTTICDVRVGDDEVLATLPLLVCQPCARTVPFRELPAANWKRDLLLIAASALLCASLLVWMLAKPDQGGIRQVALMTISVMGSILFLNAVFSATGARSRTTVADVLNRIPSYRDLIDFLSKSRLSCRVLTGIRVFEGGMEEAERFANSLQKRLTVLCPMQEEELIRARIPAIVLEATMELLDQQLLRAADGIQNIAPTIVGADVTLLPERRLMTELRIATELSEQQQLLLEDRLDELLAEIPVWPVEYPVVLSVERSFVDSDQDLHSALQPPFSTWKDMASDRQTETLAETIVRAFQVPLQNVSAAVTEADCVAFRECLPASIGLAQLHASFLEASERYSDALAVYDDVLAGFPDATDFVYFRIWCLHSSGQVERAAAECQQRTVTHPDEPEAWTAMARLLIAMERPADVLTTIERSPASVKNAELFYLRALSLAVLGRHSEALTAANKSLFMNGKSAETLLLRARLNVQLARWDLALADLRQLQRHAGPSLESLSLQAQALTELGRSREAEQIYLALLDRYSESVDLRLQFAKFLAESGKLASAREQCDRAVAMAPEQSMAYGLRAGIALEMDDYADAVQDAEVVLAMDDQDVQLRMILGLAKASQGDMDSALEEFGRCIDLDPDYLPARYQRARIYLHQDEFETAQAELSAVLLAAPEWTDAWVRRGEARLSLEQHEAAREDFDQAIQLSPECSDAYSGRAISWLIDGSKAAAEADLNKALFLNPDDVRARMNRAVLLQQQGDEELARRDLDELLAQRPDFEPALLQRAQIHMYLGEFGRAKRDFDRLVKINPGSPHSFLGRSVAAEQTGDLAGAQADHEQARQLAPFSFEELELSRTLLAASVANRNHQFDKAIQLATSVIENESELQLVAHRLRGQACWYSERFVEALEDYSLILQHPDEVTRHDFSAHGQVLAELGEFELALESLLESVRIARRENDVAGLAWSLNGQARALTGLERFEEAEQCFTESVRLKPDNAWLHFYRGLMYIAQKQPTSALACFELALSVRSPRLPPGKRNRAQGFVNSMRGTAS